MKKLTLSIAAATLACAVLTFTTKTANAPAVRATADLTCVTVQPVWVLGQQVTDQYQVCVPTP